MKILNIPIDTDNKIIKCECGCEFEYDNTDIEIISHFDHLTIQERRVIIVTCPLCYRNHELGRLNLNRD